MSNSESVPLSGLSVSYLRKNSVSNPASLNQVVYFLVV